MSWATPYLARLTRGEVVTLRPFGDSMRPLIFSGQEVIVEPLGDTKVRHGDVVLCRVHGHDYPHQVKAVQAECYWIENVRGGINGLTRRGANFGRWRRPR